MKPKPPVKLKFKTLELDKLGAVRERSQACGEFLDWLQSIRHVTLANYHVHTPGCYEVGTVKPPAKGKERTYDMGNYRRKYTDEKWRACGMSDQTLEPFHYNTERLLAEFFGIDLDRVEKERRAILDKLRSMPRPKPKRR